MALPTDPYNFSNGDTADAEQVDARFAALFAALSAGGLDASVFAAGAIPASKIQTAAWTAHTPTLTGVSGSSNTVAQRYSKIGRTVNLQGQLTLGSGGGLSADPTIALPYAASTTPDRQIGTVQAFLNASSLAPTGFCAIDTAAAGVLVVRLGKIAVEPDTSTSIQGIPQALSATFPWSWTSGDVIRWAITYESAA